MRSRWSPSDTASFRSGNIARKTVTIACDNASSYGTGGIYADFPNGAPVITVSATVPYNTFFGVLGLGTGTLNLNSNSQAAVIGA